MVKEENEMKEIILKIRLATEEEIKKQYDEKTIKKIYCRVFHITYGDKVYFAKAGINLATMVDNIKEDHNEM